MAIIFDEQRRVFALHTPNTTYMTVSYTHLTLPTTERV